MVHYVPHVLRYMLNVSKLNVPSHIAKVFALQINPLKVESGGPFRFWHFHTFLRADTQYLGTVN